MVKNISKNELPFLADADRLKGKKVTVMGLGLLSGGLGTVKFLAKKGAKVLVTDLKTKKELSASLKKIRNFRIKYVLGRHREEDFNNADMIVKNPAVPRNSKYLKIALKNNIPIENDASLFLRYCRSDVIGVTGSKGKTTTVALIMKILAKEKAGMLTVGNNITSVLDRLFLLKRRRVPVLFEMSSWRLESLVNSKKSPNVAVVTNVYPDHLNTYGGMQQYCNAKKNIFRYQTATDRVVLNKDNKYTENFGKEAHSRRYWFSRKYFKEQNGVFLNKKAIYFRENGITQKIMPLSAVKLIGPHNIENILAAITVAKIMKVKNSAITNAIRDFNGIPNRLELVRKWKGVDFYNDTAATIPDAAVAAIKSFNKKVILIAGGVDKNLDYRKFAETIKLRVKRTVLLPGTATDKITAHLQKIKYDYVRANNLSEALNKSVKLAVYGDIVLFSPAAASFNLFKNEFDRGGQFKRMVKNLK